MPNVASDSGEAQKAGWRWTALGFQMVYPNSVGESGQNAKVASQSITEKGRKLGGNWNRTSGHECAHTQEETKRKPPHFLVL